MTQFSLDVNLLRSGADAWNRARRSNPGILPDLSDADLSGCGLNGADLSGADLRRARLTEAVLDGGILTGAKLWGAVYDRWSIERIACEAVSWDERGERFLPYPSGTFTRLFNGGGAWRIAGSFGEPETPVSAEEFASILAERCLVDGEGRVTSTPEGSLLLLKGLRKTADVMDLQDKINGLETQLAARKRERDDLLLELHRLRNTGGPIQVGEQSHMAVLAADVVGFSGKPEADRRRVSEMLNILGRSLMGQHGVVAGNEWGDAVTFVAPDVNEILELALRLADHMAAEKAPIRVGLSHGALTAAHSAIAGKLDYLGFPRIEAARIEPMANSGEILASPGFFGSGLVDRDRYRLEKTHRKSKKPYKDERSGRRIEPGDIVELYSVRRAGNQ